MVRNVRNAQPSRREVCGWLAACAAGAVAGARRASAGTEDALAAARESLERGDGRQAVEMYESLVRQSESLDAELGLIRAALRAGEFRKAVANANLTAGEHPESAEAAALLAYLTDRSARTEQALAALRDLQAARPDEWAPVAAQAEILIERLAPDQAVASIETWLARDDGVSGQASAELSRLLARARLVAGTRTPVEPTSAQGMRQSWVAAGFEPLPIAEADIDTAGNGVVIDGGKSVLTYAEGLAGATHVWVRNGLGQVRRAELAPPGAADRELVRLRLDTAYPAEWSIAPPQVGAPEGVRFCFVLSFGAPQSCDPAYPSITPGVVVRADTGIGGLMQISSQLGPRHNGAPLFDARGQLLGLGLASGEHTIAGQPVREALGAGALALRVDRALHGSAAAAPARPSQALPPMPAIEELYERLSPCLVQVVAGEIRAVW